MLKNRGTIIFLDEAACHAKEHTRISKSTCHPNEIENKVVKPQHKDGYKVQSTK